MNTLYSPSLGETFRGPKATINPQASVSGRTHTESAHRHISYNGTSLRDISSRAQKVATRVAAEQSLQGLSTSSNERAAPVVRIISTFSDEIDLNEEEDALRSTSKVPALLKVNLDLLLVSPCLCGAHRAHVSIAGTRTSSITCYSRRNIYLYLMPLTERSVWLSPRILCFCLTCCRLGLP